MDFRQCYEQAEQHLYHVLSSLKTSVRCSSDMTIMALVINAYIKYFL